MTGVLRITAAPEPGGGLQDYLDRLVKLIPAEIVGIYLIGTGAIPADQSLGLAIWAGICFGLVVLVRAMATRDAGGHPQWAAVVVSAVAFVIWSYTMGGPFSAYHILIGWIGSLAVLLWTFGVPYFYKGS